MLNQHLLSDAGLLFGYVQAICADSWQRVVVHLDGTKVILGKRKGPLGTGTYSLPGGKVDFGETPIAAAIREVEEETKLKLTRVHFTGKVTNDYFPDEGKQYVTLYYIAEAVNPEDLTVTEPDKVESWDWYVVTEPLPQPMWMHTELVIGSLTSVEVDFKTLDIDG